MTGTISGPASSSSLRTAQDRYVSSPASTAIRFSTMERASGA